MKKNLALRLASGLMLSCLLTSCVISGTFAKYTTSDSATDSARVAAWGVTVIASDNTAFGKTYEKDDANFTLTENTVVSTEYVVAPGTDGTLSKLDVSGTPEVAVRVTYDATLTLANWTVGGNDYCPIVFTVNGANIKMEGEIDTVEKLANAVVKAIEDTSTDYEAGTDLSEVEDDLSVSWAWAFEGDDVKDTALGNAATKATIELEITTTITQVD